MIIFAKHGDNFKEKNYISVKIYNIPLGVPDSSPVHGLWGFFFFLSSCKPNWILNFSRFLKYRAATLQTNLFHFPHPSDLESLWRKIALEPHWKGPPWTLLTPWTTARLQGLGPWVHIFQLKGVPVDSWTCPPARDLKLKWMSEVLLQKQGTSWGGQLFQGHRSRSASPIWNFLIHFVFFCYLLFLSVNAWGNSAP